MIVTGKRTLGMFRQFILLNHCTIDVNKGITVVLTLLSINIIHLQIKYIQGSMFILFGLLNIGFSFEWHIGFTGDEISYEELARLKKKELNEQNQ